MAFTGSKLGLQCQRRTGFAISHQAFSPRTRVSSLLGSVPNVEQSLGRLKSVCKDRQLTRAEVFQPRLYPFPSPTSSLAGLCPTEGSEGPGPCTSNSTAHRAGLTERWGPEGRGGEHKHLHSWLSVPLAFLSKLPARIWSPSNPSSQCDLPLPVSFFLHQAAASAWDQNDNQDAIDTQKIHTDRWPPFPCHPYVGEN